MYQGKYFQIDDFTGGMVNVSGNAVLPLNTAIDVDNIIVYPRPNGFATRNGTTTVVSSLDGDGTGLGYFLLSSGSAYLICVAGTKIYSDPYAPDSSWTDITGALTISTSTSSTWDIFTFNDVAIGFGGGSSASSPDAPWKWTGSGNAALLTGSPPTAYGGFTANNRVFAYRTSANTSTIYWSIVGNAEDWTSTGSGSAVVGSLNDSEAITGAVLANTNSALLFKKNSIYQMVLTQAPFPIFLYKTGIGCPNKKAVTVIDDVVYFYGSDNRVYEIRNGQLIPLPDTVNFFTSTSINQEKVRIFGQKGNGFNWLVITGTHIAGAATSAAIWDITNKCWLKCTGGYKGLTGYVNVPAFGSSVPPRTYTTNDDQTVKLLDVAGDYRDSYEGNTTTYTAYWRSGWLSPTNGNEIVQVNRFVGNFARQSSGISVTLNYGYNLTEDSGSASLSVAAVASEVLAMPQAFLTGRGNYFQYKLSLANATNSLRCFNVLLGGKVYGQKKRGVS